MANAASAPTRQNPSGFFGRGPSTDEPDPAPPPPDVVEIRQLVRMIVDNWLFVLAIAALVFVSVMSATLVSSMEFVSSGRLYLGELDAKPRAGGTSPAEIEISGSSEGEVASEIEIIRSRSLATQAILKSGHNVRITPALEEPPRYWQWLASGRDPELLDKGLRELRAIDTTLADRFRESQTYNVKFTSESEYELRSGNRLLTRAKLAEPVKHSDLNLTLVSADNRKPRPGAEYTMVVQPIEGVVDRVLGNLLITAPKAGSSGAQVNVLTLEYTAASPRSAAALLDQLMQAYLKERQAWKTEDASAAEAFVSTQLRSMRDSLDDVQRKLADYRTNNRVVVLDNEAKAMIEQIAKYEEQRVAARLEVAALNDIQRSLKNSDAPMGAYLLGESRDSVLENMAASLSSARQKLTDLETRFSDAAPDVREQRAQVEGQLEAIKNYVSSRHARAQEHLGTLNGIIGQFEQRLKTVPGAELGLAQLARESEVYSRTYSYLLERQQQAAIVKASRLSKNRVLDAPQVPLRESSPKLMLRLLSGVAGLVIGAAVIVLKNLTSGTLQNRLDVQRLIGRRPLVGSIPRRPRQRRGRAQADSLLDAPSGPMGRYVEAFRTLRTNLYRRVAELDDGGKLILVTSPKPGDGKTTCVSWLSAVLAADGQRVLAVDADFRKPTPPVPIDVAGHPQELGLRGILNGQCQFRDVLRKMTVASGNGEHYEVIAGGRLPPEALSSDRLERFLDEARERFDFVLIDTPSFPFVSDALVLAPAADVVLSVVRLHHTPRALATEHLQGFNDSGAVHAVVLNQAGAPASRASSKPSGRGPSLRLGPPSKRPKGKSSWRPTWWAAAAVGLSFVLAFLHKNGLASPEAASGASVTPASAGASKHR